MSASLHVVPAEPAEPAEPAFLDQPVRYFGHGGAVTGLQTDTLRDHLARFGARPSCVETDLIAGIDASGLTGRGGAHRSVAFKWRAVRAAAGAAPTVVVANGAEGEPDSRKDVALLEFRPHAVLDGLACAAEALGAEQAIVWLHEGSHAARSAVAHALAERRAARLDEPAMRIATGPDRYLTGESSAVVQALSGGPALPTFRVQPSARHGVHGRPTLINNVETLARVATIARGMPPDLVLVTVAVGDARVVLESPSDASLRSVVARVTGPTPPAAVLLGGYGGAWVGWDDLAGATLAENSLRERGLSLGAGVLGVLQQGDCGLARTAQIIEYLAGQSARQCGPCLFGLRALADGMTALGRGGRRSRRQSRQIATFLAEIRGRGACGHPDGAVRIVASALDAFADDVRAHQRGRCLATGRGR